MFLFPFQEFQQPFPGIILLFQFTQVAAEGTDRTVEGHVGHHGRVADRLQVHMPPVPGTLELYDDEIGMLVNAQEVYPALAVVPVVELFGNDQGIRRDHIDLPLQQLLEMFPFPEARIGETRRFHGP